MSLQEAQRSGLATSVKTHQQNAKAYSAFRSNVELACTKGVINSYGAKIGVEEAIRERLLDINDLKYVHPKNGERIELTKAAHMGLVDLTLAELLPTGVTNPSNGARVSVRAAISLGIIDPRSGAVRNPSSGERLTWIDITKNLAPPNALEGARHSQPALGEAGGLLDADQAAAAGLLDTGASTEKEETQLARVFDSPAYDASSGRVRDAKSGLNWNFRDAIERRLIDPESLLHDLDSQRMLTLREALSAGLIDSNGRVTGGGGDSRAAPLPLAEAVRIGRIALIASPMQAAQAVAEAVKRRDAEGTRFKLAPVDKQLGGASRASQPRVREEETTVIRRLTPKREEPTLSFRVRSNVSDDHRSSRGRSLVDDPLALADQQADFLDALVKRGVDIDERIVENPATMRPVSIREAVESQLLDVTTKEIVNPQSGRRYTLPARHPTARHGARRRSHTRQCARRQLGRALADVASVRSARRLHATSRAFARPHRRRSASRCRRHESRRRHVGVDDQRSARQPPQQRWRRRRRQRRLDDNARSRMARQTRGVARRY